MRADQFTETLRSWRGFYNAAFLRPTRASYHCTSKTPGEHWSFDPESFLQLLPVTTARPRLSRMPSVLSTHWRIV